MSDEIPRLDTTAIIPRFAAGDNEALDEYIARYRGKFVRTANRLIHKLGIDTASLAGDGAVNMALIELWQMRDLGHLRPIQDSDEILKLMNVILERLIRHEYRRSEAIKHRGGGTSQAGHAAGRRDLKAGEKGGAHQGYLRIDGADPGSNLGGPRVRADPGVKPCFLFLGGPRGQTLFFVFMADPRRTRGHCFLFLWRTRGQT